MIRDDEIAALLQAGTDDIDVAITPAGGLAEAGRRRLRRRRAVLAVGAVASVAAVVTGASLVSGSNPDGVGPATGPSTTTVSPAGCVANVPSRVLPTWARTGFSDPRPRAPFVLGQRGDIVAILFGQPLSAPPAAGRNNKILWVSGPQIDGTTTSTDSPDLRIDARRSDGSETVTRTVAGGPGPSIIDLPTAGCWHLTLRWSGHTDSLDLEYVAPR